MFTQKSAKHLNFPCVMVSRLSVDQSKFIVNKSHNESKALAEIMREIVTYYMDNHK